MPLMTRDGSYIVQTIYRTQPSMTVTAVSEDRTDFQSRASNDVAPMGLGYEHVLNAKLGENATRWANDAVEKLSARPVDPGKYDLVLHPSNLWLTLHETVAPRADGGCSPQGFAARKQATALASSLLYREINDLTKGSRCSDTALRSGSESSP